MRVLRVVGILCFFIVVACAAWAGDSGHEAGYVTLTSPARIGGTLLPAGDYQVRHTMEGEEHVMVFHSVNHKTPDVKARCKMLELGKKADATRTVYDENAAHERVLIELVFAGDAQKHIFF